MNKLKLTIQDCKKIALNYSNKTAFKVRSGPIYHYAYKAGWLDECCLHMQKIKEVNGYWTYIKCSEEAKKYPHRSVFAKESASAYSVAKKKNG